MRIPLVQSNAGIVTTAAAAPFTAAQLAGLQPGAIVSARVLALLEQGQVQLAIGNSIIEASSRAPLTPGTTVELAVQSNVNGLTLQIVSPGSANAAAAVSAGGVNSPAQLAGAAAAVPPAADAALPAVTQSGGAAVTAVAAADAAGAVSAATVSGAGAVAAQNFGNPATPQSAQGDAVTPLVQAVRSAATTQNSLAPLFAEVEAVAALATGLPEPVQRAALRLLSLRPSLDEELDGETVRQAFVNSGLFLEAQIAEATGANAQSGNPENAALAAELSAAIGQPQAAAPGLPPAIAAATQLTSGPADTATASGGANGAAVDLKAALMVFRAVVAAVVAEEAPLVPADTAANASHDAVPPAAAVASPPVAPETPLRSAQPPPPFRGAPTAAQPSAAATIDAATPPQQAARVLMAATDAALSRQTLLQVASLPASGSSPRAADSGPRWNFEVPFATPQGTRIAQFEISRDGRGNVAPDELKPVWRARFSIAIDPLGPVHAQISLRGRRAAVTLWAESAEGAGRLRAGTATLADALRAADLDAGDLVVRDGTPRVPGASAMPAGHFLDRAS